MPDTRRLTGTLGLLIMAGVAVAAAYGATLAYGFHYDDYHFVRPWTPAELRSVLTGTWDPSSIERPFYRPVTAWWYAVRFDLFGLNAWPQRALTLGGMTLAACLAGIFAARETGRRAIAPVTAVVYGVHPALAYAQVAWLTNQMHLLASLVVLAALLVWQRAREGSTAAWMGVLLIQIVAFGIKEDTIMLTPVLLALTALRARFKGDAARPGVTVLVACGVVCAALPVLRHLALGTIGGYGVPEPAQAWSNFRRGLGVLTLTPADRPWQLVASLGSTMLIVGGIVAGLLRRAPASTYFFVVGLVVVLGFNLPFALVSKAEQLHLVALGASLALAGALMSLLDSLRAWPARLVVVLGFVVTVGAMVPLAGGMAADFAPCSPSTRLTDGYAADWGVVPGEIRRWLAEKPARCELGAPSTLVDSLPVVVFAHNLEVDERGDPFQWTSDRSTALVRATVAEARLAVRSPGARPDQPVTVSIIGPGGVQTFELTSGDWYASTVALGPSWRSRLRGAHRIDLHVTPVFVPADIDPSSPDRRTLGVQLKVIQPERERP